jgi:hypothetical protein
VFKIPSNFEERKKYERRSLKMNLEPCQNSVKSYKKQGGVAVFGENVTSGFGSKTFWKG